MHFHQVPIWLSSSQELCSACWLNVKVNVLVLASFVGQTKPEYFVLFSMNVTCLLSYLHSCAFPPLVLQVHVEIEVEHDVGDVHDGDRDDPHWHHT